MKKVLKVIIFLVVVLVLIVAAYVAYAYLSYHRLADKIDLEVKNSQSAQLAPATEYQILSFNIGYGAYPQDYSFFMAGGKYSRAYDQETVEKDLQGIFDIVKNADPDLFLMQEVDVNGDRSFHVNQVAKIRQGFTDYGSVFAQNYDSPYLFYPLLDPIGKAKSGLVTAARYEITDSMRYSLPIETNFNKFFDLDRAFSVSHLPVENGGTLALINTHLSAFTKDPAVRQAQMDKLFQQMETEYQAGHYVIVGGDYNHDLLGNSPTVFNTKEERETWTHPFPIADLPTGFRAVTETLADAAIPSVRDSNAGYQKGSTYVSLIDGFLISENVKASAVEVLDEAFLYSDHNPIVMHFSLQ